MKIDFKRSFFNYFFLLAMLLWSARLVSGLVFSYVVFGGCAFLKFALNLSLVLAIRG